MTPEQRIARLETAMEETLKVLYSQALGETQTKLYEVLLNFREDPDKLPKWRKKKA